MSQFGANHSNYNFVVAYGSRTGGRDGYNDTNVEATVAAFMLMRGQHWLFSIGPNGGGGGKSYPPYDNDPGTLTPATAKILLSDYGAPKGSMTAVTGKEGVFQREYAKATIRTISSAVHWLQIISCKSPSASPNSSGQFDDYSRRSCPVHSTLFRCRRVRCDSLSLH